MTSDFSDLNNSLALIIGFAIRKSAKPPVKNKEIMHYSDVRRSRVAFSLSIEPTTPN